MQHVNADKLLLLTWTVLKLNQFQRYKNSYREQIVFYWVSYFSSVLVYVTDNYTKNVIHRQVNMINAWVLLHPQKKSSTNKCLRLLMKIIYEYFMTALILVLFNGIQMCVSLSKLSQSIRCDRLHNTIH